MPTDGSSPSAGWREVYHAMGADPSTDERLRSDGGRAGLRGPRTGRCPDCKGRPSGPGDLCCDAYAERLRTADGGRPD